uniref:Uncharacterized protein n=1 Tax=Arundo donax TaxID=35708 RepID=A0A0A9H718_ARUDO
MSRVHGGCVWLDGSNSGTTGVALLDKHNFVHVLWCLVCKDKHLDYPMHGLVLQHSCSEDLLLVTPSLVHN